MTNDPIVQLHRRAASSSANLSVAEVLDRTVAAQAELRAAQLHVVDTRLDAMDKAAIVLSETVTRMPTQLEVAVAQINELHNVKFAAISDRFELLDRQTVREKAAAELALAAAFNAQKEAAAATNNSNAEAIRVNQSSTAKQIETNQIAGARQIETINDGLRAASRAMGDKLDDLKDRVNRIEAGAAGATNQKGDVYRLISAAIAFFGLVAVVVALVISFKA